MKGAILQLNVSDLPSDNLPQTLDLLRQAAMDGAEIVFTPEVTNCVSTSRAHQMAVLQDEASDATLVALRQAAIDLGVWLHIGSLALKTDDPDGRFANRCFLIDPLGNICARYDKIHMFDVQISESETYQESSGYRPGTQAVTAQTPFGQFGFAICYDMRFPLLSNALAAAGAQILTYPAAFSPITGAAHWHSLLRARAIETGSFVIAAAQTGTHASAKNKTRDTFGHSLVVAPWGEVLLDAGQDSGVYAFQINENDVAEARRRVPALQNARPFTGP